MCLIIDKNLNKKYKPMIADKDLVCYKVLKQKGWLFKHFYSPYFDFEWKKNVEYTIEMNVSVITHGEHFVKKGFHAFINKELIDFRCIPCFITTCDGKTKPLKQILVECIIPKGSEYYIGKNNDIVSNKMKFVKILK